mgnify:CR=1 FL=1
MPSGCTFNGNGNTIIVKNINALFDQNCITIENLNVED